jgi:hypothetical protein
MAYGPDLLFLFFDKAGSSYMSLNRNIPNFCAFSPIVLKENNPSDMASLHRNLVITLCINFLMRQILY